MPTSSSSRALGGRWLPMGVAACMLVTILVTVLSLAGSGTSTAAPVASGTLRPISEDAPPVPAKGAPNGEPGAPPVSIDIPSIKVRSELDDLRLLADGSLATPRDAARAGWWSQGPRPGDVGTAVVVGHVDSYDGPGVFLLLHRVAPGAEIVIARNDGPDLVFVVDAVRQYRKDEFPDDVVYGGTSQPELRLITCGGSFDETERRYSDNVVVFAHLREEQPS